MHAIFHIVLASFEHSEENRKDNIFLFRFNLCIYVTEKYRLLYSQKTKSKMAMDVTDLKKKILFYIIWAIRHIQLD